MLAKKEFVTVIIRELAPKAINSCEEEISGCAATIQSYHVEGVQINGHPTDIIPTEAYYQVTKDPAWNQESSEPQEEYDLEAVGELTNLCNVKWR